MTDLHAIGLIEGFAVRTSLDGAPKGSLGIMALMVNLGLLLPFAVQHSVMARSAFKRGWTKIVPTEMGRSTYVLLSSLGLLLLYWQWRPMAGMVWQVTDPAVMTTT